MTAACVLRDAADIVRAKRRRVRLLPLTADGSSIEVVEVDERDSRVKCVGKVFRHGDLGGYTFWSDESVEDDVLNPLPTPAAVVESVCFSVVGGTA